MLTESRLWFCKIIPEAACEKLILACFLCKLLAMHTHRKYWLKCLELQKYPSCDTVPLGFHCGIYSILSLLLWLVWLWDFCIFLPMYCRLIGYGYLILCYENLKYVFPKFPIARHRFKFIFPQIFFLILCCLFYQWGRRLECWRWSASWPAAGITRCSQLSSSWQVRQHGLPSSALIMVKSLLLGHYPPVELVRTPIKAKTLAFCLIQYLKFGMSSSLHRNS